MSRPDGWLGFWQSRVVTPSRDVVWRMSMEHFVEATEPIMQYGPGDVVLDVGCGAGYLPELLHAKVGEIHGVDVSQAYIDHCRAKFGAHPNCRFDMLDQERYTDFDFLPPKRFTKIVCLSVVQYYRRREDLEALVRGLQRVAAPGALCLISDLPATRKRGSDSLPLLRLAYRRGRLAATVRYLLQMRLTEYHTVRASEGLLTFCPEELDGLAGRLGLHAEVLDRRLTTNASRHHWLIRF